MKKKEERRRRRKGGEGKKFRASPRLAVGVKRYQLCYATLMNVPLETATRRGREREREKWREEKRERKREREQARSTWLDCFNDRLYARAFVHARCASRKPRRLIIVLDE